MPEELVIRHCAPTLAGLKTGSLFCCPYRSARELTESIRRYNDKLLPKGLRVIPLKKHNGCALIYVYRPARLLRDLGEGLAQKLLRERGYPAEQGDRCLLRLMRRLQESKEFPHEIGLFLGYPPEDVQGFIENRAGGYQCAGCWKVYGDAARAQRTFAKYKKCTDVYCRCHAQGTPIERLTVVG